MKNQKSKNSTQSSHASLLAELQDAREQLNMLMVVQKGYNDILLSSARNNSGIALVNSHDLRLQYVSPSSAFITGYTPAELIGKKIIDYVHPDDAQCVNRLFSEILSIGELDNCIEFRLRHINGMYIDIETTGKHLASNSGSGGIIIHYRNITERKQSERTRFTQKQFYEAILNTIYDGVCVTDQNNSITYTNRGFTLTTGLLGENVLGRNFLYDATIVTMRHIVQHYEKARNLLTPVNFDSIPAVHTTGKTIFLSGWCIPQLVNGGFAGMICSFTDISEHQRIKVQLSESETRFRSIAETATDGIITVLGGGEIVFWNKAATSIFGYSKEEVLGKDVFRIMPADIMSSHMELFAVPERSSTNDSIGRTIEGRAMRKDGTPFPVEISLASWKIESDVYFTAIIRDITHRKHIEQSLQRSEQELKELSSRLLHVHEQERKRIAYELHDGLGQILSAAKIGLKAILGDPLKKGLCEFRNSVDNPLTIIQTAIDEVRRISRDLRPTILDDLGLIAALDAFCRDFSALNPHINLFRQIDVQDTDIPEPVKIVIYRIIQEACTNIVRHSHADKVSLRLVLEDNCLRLFIEDNGRGFNPQKVNETSDTRRGLGLSSMKERVEYSGGIFALSSANRQGTMLQARWPLQLESLL